jgi:hypothetical protein
MVTKSKTVDNRNKDASEGELGRKKFYADHQG